MHFIGFLASLFFTQQCFRAHQQLKPCTANSACRWLCAGSVSLLVTNALAAICDWFPDLQQATLNSVLQYSTALLILAAPVDLLGARRPGHDAWPWFVVLPMLFVFQWPSLTQWYSGTNGIAVEIPAPTFVGFLLVVVMATGNFFGTTNTTSAILAAVGLTLLALPTTEFCSFESPFFPIGTICIAVSAKCFHIKASPLNSAGLWFLFRDLYGIVWAKRVADRINQFDSQGTTETKLTIDGLFHKGRLTDSWPEVTIKRLAWVLRRFLDQEFLKEYLPHDALDSLPNAERP